MGIIDASLGRHIASLEPRSLVIARYPDAHLYHDAASDDGSEKWMVIYQEDVIGAGPTRTAAWLDALSHTSS